jgi:hypothetical protein
MKLALARNQEKHNGFMICDMDTNTTLMYVDGNANKQVPVAVLALDPHVVYGMSHPSVVSRIFSEGPQTLITIKKLAHSLFEHGMKASLGTITLGATPLFTQLLTFYDVQDSVTLPNDVHVSVHAYPKEDKVYLKVSHAGKIYVISPISIKPQIDEPIEKFVSLGVVLDYVLLEPNE